MLSFARSLSLNFGRRSFSNVPSTKLAVIEAVKSFTAQRKHEIASELVHKGEAASEAERTAAQETLAKLSKEVNETSVWRDFGFDGLDEVECLLTIEDALGVRVPDEEFHGIHGVSDALHIAQKYLDKSTHSA